MPTRVKRADRNRKAPRGRGGARSGPTPCPEEAGGCRWRPSVFRGYFDCLSEDGRDCPHALSHEGGTLCLRPIGETMKDPRPERPGSQSSHSGVRRPARQVNLSFRPGTKEDCRLLGRLNYQLIHDLGLPHRMTVAAMGKRMQTLLASDHQAILFELRGRVIAYALYRESPNEIYLRQFLVIRALRGQGIARRALGMLRSQVWARTKLLTVDVLVGNRRALEFWRRVGYADHSLRMEIPPVLPDPAPFQASREKIPF